MVTSESKEVSKSESKYPCLMIGVDSKNVVLFESYGKGTVIHLGTGNADYKIGNHSTSWAMSCFTPYNGEIVLKGE